jgi:hypothetical protein
MPAADCPAASQWSAISPPLCGVNFCVPMPDILVESACFDARLRSPFIMLPNRPIPIHHQKQSQRQLRAFRDRPVYRNYGVAYVLIGSGFLFGNLATAAGQNAILRVLAGTLFIAGLLLLISSIAFSISLCDSWQPVARRGFLTVIGLGPANVTRYSSLSAHSVVCHATFHATAVNFPAAGAGG